MRRAWMCAIAGLIGLPQMRIATNIPAYRLDVYVDDSLVRSMPVAPGMPGFRTPRGEFAISSVEWNPWWIPPDSPWALDTYGVDTTLVDSGRVSALVRQVPQAGRAIPVDSLVRSGVTYSPPFLTSAARHSVDLRSRASATSASCGGSP